MKTEMTIDEAIKRFGDIRNNYDKWSGLGLTPNESEAFELAIDTMRKYQKIQEIVKEWREVGLEYDSCDAMMNIERCLNGSNKRL